MRTCWPGFAAFHSGQVAVVECMSAVWPVGHGTVNTYFHDHREPDGAEVVNALKRFISSNGTDPIHVRKAETEAG
jgi:hypothetical protein